MTLILITCQALDRRVLAKSKNRPLLANSPRYTAANMANERFLILSEKPTGNGFGAYHFGDLVGYGVIDLPTLEEAKLFCRSHVDVVRFGKFRVVDRQAWNGETIDVLFEAP